MSYGYEILKQLEDLNDNVKRLIKLIEEKEKRKSKPK